MSILAIDAGTTGVTALVVTPEGTIAAKGYQEFRQHFPQPGWVEHSPEEIWQATLEAVRDCLQSWSGSASDLKAIGITNQRETVLLWDRETLGSPRRAIVWQDRRTADICRRMKDEGHEERVTELTGLRLDPYFSGTKLVWLQENEPNTWALVEEGRYAIGTVDSYLIARMTRGTWHITDVSNACRTLLFDLEQGAWSEELCELFGVPMDALPEIVPNWGELATTDPRVVPRPRAARRRHRRRPAVRAVRADLLRRRRLQVHLRHRLVHPHQHRRRGGALRRGPAQHGGLEVPRREAHLRPGRGHLRHRRRRAVAARRPADRRVRRRDRGDRRDGRRQRRGGLRARAHRARRPPLGPARPRHDPRHHPGYDAGPRRPGHPRGDHLRGARRHRHHADQADLADGRRRRGGQRPALPVPGRPARRTRAAAGDRRDHRARRGLHGRARRRGLGVDGRPARDLEARPGVRPRRVRRDVSERTEAAYALWQKGVERSRDWAE